MRIDRLDLTRYGRFTDATLPFGAPCGGRPDLHIVYGDNEAGKTTTLNALLDLLFGLEPGTPYKFLHQAPAMRLGGALDIGGVNREVIRLPKSALLDADERPLAEGLFSPELAGLDRAAFRAMFLLDEKTLAAGGESILANKGELGPLLFSATAGIADFGPALSKLKLETEAFYKLHGRKHELGDLKKQLATLKERRAAIDVMAAPFARLISARDEALAAYEEAVVERGCLQSELETARRHLSTLPRLAERRALKREHDALPAAPDVPSGWVEEVAELQRTSVALATRRAASEEEIARLSADVDALPLDEPALAVAERVERAADLRDRNAGATRDLPDRRARLRVADAEVARILADLGHEGADAPHDLLLRPAVTERLRQGLESLSGTVAALSEARSEFADAESRFEAAHAAFEQAGALPDDAPASFELRSAIAGADADDSASRLQIADRSCSIHGDALAERLAALAPWRGTARELAILELPSQAERDDLARGVAEARRRRDQLLAETDQLGRDARRLKDARRALRRNGALIDDAMAAASRKTRDDAWSRHLDQLDGTSAKAFEDALRADDARIEARFSQTNDLTQLRSLERSLEVAFADLDEINHRLDLANTACFEAERRLATRVESLVGPDCAAPLASFDAFLAKRERALDARDLLRSAEADRTAAAIDANACRSRLEHALAAVGADVPAGAAIGVLICAGRAFLEGQAAAQALRQRCDDLRREVEERKRTLQRAERGREAWERAWRQALQATWLEGTSDVDAVRDALNGLAELGPALEKRDELADRVAKMEATLATFAIEVSSVADHLDLERGDDMALLADRIAARVAGATSVAAARVGKVRDLAAAQERLATVFPAIEVATRRIREMTERFGVASLDDLAVAFESSRRRADLHRRIAALDIEISDACGSASVDEADAKLTAIDRDGLERRRAELDARCADQIERTQERFAALGRARGAVEAIDGDAAAARLEEERRTVLLEIEDRTMAHLTMRAGIIAADNAIGLYRDRHRSAMMAQASDLFATLSRGAYAGLAAQGAKDGEVLVGLPAGGGSKLSTEMSTATRNQLYLALRIAAYREFVKTRRAVPFVLDDVLETFDDDRAEASLKLLAEMANTGQVIYLTHHRHLCTIARRVCPEAKLHDLGSI